MLVHKVTATGLLLILIFCTVTPAVQAHGLKHDASGEGSTIIRSFFPIPGGPKQRNQEFIFFNISAVRDNEEIFKSRFHLHRRRMSKLVSHAHDRQLLPPPCRVIVYQVRSLETKPRRLTSLPISPVTPGGWVLLDFTSALRELHARASLVAIRFEGPKGVRLTVTNFLKPVKTKKSKAASAYLVIYSRSDENEGLFEMKERHMKHKEWKADHNEMPNEITPTEVRHRSKHKVYEVERSKEAELELARRTRLQSLPFLHVNEVADMRRSIRKVKRSIQAATFDAVMSQPQWETKPHHKEVHESTKSDDGSCHRRKVHVPFSEGWILTPSAVVTHVCGGHCHMKTPNSTIMKGCCKPGRRRPLTMITADETNSLALHKIPGLLVEDCVCAHCRPT